MNTTVTNVEVNGGEPVSVRHDNNVYALNLAGQTSVVHHLCITFSGPVVLEADAVTVVPKDGVTVVSGAAPNQAPVTTFASPLLGSNGTKWIIRFSGAGADGSSGKIKNGLYVATVKADKVTGVGGPLAADYPYVFIALFAAKIITQPTALVGAEQVAAVQAAFGQAIENAEFSPVNDANLDGYIDPVDLFNASDVSGTEWTW